LRWSLRRGRLGISYPSFCPQVLFLALGILGNEVDGVWDNSWRGCFAVQFYLAAKTSHVGVDVDGLGYPPHRPTVNSYQTRGHGLSTRRCLVLSLQWVVVTFRGCAAPWAKVFDGEFTASALALLNLTYCKSFLPCDTYPMVELS
jgi:hypothetical protein